MVASLSDDEIVERLDSAKKELANLFPPQADKILRALQHVELASQHFSIDPESEKVMREIRVALRALNQVELKRDFPRLARLAVSHAITGLVSIIKAIRETQNPPQSVQTVRDDPVLASGRPDRRTAHTANLEYEGPRRRDDDDTVDGLKCLEEDLVLLSHNSG